jgi:hypothetical protein
MSMTLRTPILADPEEVARRSDCARPARARRNRCTEIQPAQASHPKRPGCRTEGRTSSQRPGGADMARLVGIHEIELPKRADSGRV